MIKALEVQVELLIQSRCPVVLTGLSLEQFTKELVGQIQVTLLVSLLLVGISRANDASIAGETSCSLWHEKPVAIFTTSSIEHIH